MSKGKIFYTENKMKTPIGFVNTPKVLKINDFKNVLNM